MTHCPHCGELLERDEAQVRWYIADDGRPPEKLPALGAKLLGAMRSSGQAVYVSADGKNMRRMGIVASADGRAQTGPDERQPIIVTPQEFQRLWRRVGFEASRPKTRAAGGAR